MNVAPVAPSPAPARGADAPSAAAAAFGNLLGATSVVAGTLPVVASAATMTTAPTSAQPIAIKAPAADPLPSPLTQRDAGPAAQPAPTVATTEPDMPVDPTTAAAPATPKPTAPPPPAPTPATMVDVVAAPMATLQPVVAANALTPKLSANGPESDDGKAPTTTSKPKSAKAAHSATEAQQQPVQLVATPVVAPPAARIPNPVAGAAQGKDEDSAGPIGSLANRANSQTGPRDAVAAGTPLPAHVAPDNLPPLLASQTPGAAIAPPTGQTPSYAPAPAQRPTPVVAAEPGRIGRDIGVEIARQVSAGRDEVMIRLSPAEMGRVDVRLSFDSKGALHAAVSADNPQALDMLRRDAGDLGRSLADAGIRTDSFTFDSRGSGAGQFAQQQQQQGGNGQPRHPATPFEADSGDAAPAPSPYRQLRTSGRVDLMA